MNNEVRWKQRFESLQKAFLQLEQACGKKKYSRLESAGFIQTFSFTFELAWKTLRGFLESRKVDAKFPRDVIKQAFQYELIKDGETWMEMLDKRNVFAHVYDKSEAEKAVEEIRKKYFPSLKQAVETLRNEIRIEQ
jgi:nucleotidyltransferase substrate binding protein (TIGR01987 family)